ncbi:MAG TPA: hypothetical protein ENJ69_00985 [Bacteroidetes bacterium]|nr:hypothetical protein [Bacteroidota bacterium]
MFRHVFLFTSLILCSFLLKGQTWAPDAGLVKPFPARVTVSSGQNPAFITDGNPHTFWQSGSPLPDGYLSRKDLNFFLNPQHYTLQPALAVSHAAFDGNTNTSLNLPAGKQTLRLQPASPLLLLSVKAHVQDTLHLILQTENGRHLRYTYTPSDNFKLKEFHPRTSAKIVALSLVSAAPYQLFELAALDKAPVETVVFDYGRVRRIGWISSRQLNSRVTNIRVLAGNDRQHWREVATLNPKAIPFLHLPLTHPVQARYLKVVFSLPLSNYQKAVLWEFAVYDKNGPYGPRPPAKPSANTFSQAFGVNTVWGWGYSVYSDRLKPNTGPQKFSDVAKNIRSYERLDWDMVSPQQTPDFDRMAAGAGTPAKPWLNWDREYKNWKQNGFRIDITLAFKQDNFPDTLWKAPYREAFAFGKAYATHFFKKEHLVSMVEVGNEPWDYSGATYRKILNGMTAGMRSVSNVTVLSCAVQAFAPQKDDNDYIARYLDAGSRKVSGLNAHIYSYVFQENGQRKAVAPEDPRSEVWSMNNLLRFRDKNLPGKPVYVTEFGYDSDGGGEKCTHGECVSEKEQAVFGVRMAMILWRLGARQFYWYYFANVAYSSFLHNRSGLTGSYNTGFRDKLSFRTFAFLQKQIGSYRFKRILREDTGMYAYLLENPNTGRKAIIAWRPTLQHHFVQKPETLSVPGRISRVVSVTNGQPVPFQTKINSVHLNLSGAPVLIFLKQ